MKPTREQFVEAILKIERFSPAPRVLSRALALLRNPDSDLDGIVDLIKTDTALTSDVIRGANSAFYSAGERVSSLDRALQKIGFREGIRLLNLAVARIAASRNLGSYGIAAEDFWTESLFHGLLVEQLAAHTRAVSADEGHTAGLLRYIGRLAINQAIDDLGGGLFWDARTPIETWELENTGVTQAQAGAILLKKWQFSDAMVQGIEWQDAPEQAPGGSWIAGALKFATVVLPSGIEAATMPRALAVPDEVIAAHWFVLQNGLQPAEIRAMIETARDGVGAVSRKLFAG